MASTVAVEVEEMKSSVQTLLAGGVHPNCWETLKTLKHWIHNMKYQTSHLKHIPQVVLQLLEKVENITHTYTHTRRVSAVQCEKLLTSTTTVQCINSPFTPSVHWTRLWLRLGCWRRSAVIAAAVEQSVALYMSVYFYISYLIASYHNI